MAFFLKNGQGLLLVGQIILYIFLKIEQRKRIKISLTAFSFLIFI